MRSVKTYYTKGLFSGSETRFHPDPLGDLSSALLELTAAVGGSCEMNSAIHKLPELLFVTVREGKLFKLFTAGDAGLGCPLRVIQAGKDPRTSHRAAGAGDHTRSEKQKEGERKEAQEIPLRGLGYLIRFDRFFPLRFPVSSIRGGKPRGLRPERREGGS